MTNIFFFKSYAKSARETIPRPLSKKIKIEYIFGSKVQSFKQFNSIVCKFEGYGNIEKSSCRPLAFT